MIPPETVLTLWKSGTRNLLDLLIIAHLRTLPPGPITGYTLTYHFKTNRHWDDDNAIGAAKAYRDGIAHALRIDDRTIFLAALPLLLTDPANPRLQIHLHVA